ESVADVARVFSRYCDFIIIRTYAQKEVEDLARYASVPVINALTDLLHPCQVLSDAFTIMEIKGRLEGISIAYVGDGNNIAHSLLNLACRIPLDLRIATPPMYQPVEGIVENARKHGISRISLTSDPVEAVRGADVVYTDVWASMGQKHLATEKEKALSPYQVNAELVKHAKPDFIFMHCLPAERGKEVTDEVIDGPNSVVFEQAENRLHMQKALLAYIFR
ncbi:MAG: ornithine carbamoyltransferase, partial [bacterium]